jgi:hypothetical protein
VNDESSVVDEASVEDLAELRLDAQGRPDRLTILRTVSGKSLAPDGAADTRSSPCPYGIGRER